MLDAYLLLVGQRQCHLNHAAQLADIARPGVTLEQPLHFHAQSSPLVRLAVLFPDSLEQRALVGTQA